MGVWLHGSRDNGHPKPVQRGPDVVLAGRKCVAQALARPALAASDLGRLGLTARLVDDLECALRSPIPHLDHGQSGLGLSAVPGLAGGHRQAACPLGHAQCHRLGSSFPLCLRPHGAPRLAEASLVHDGAHCCFACTRGLPPKAGWSRGAGLVMGQGGCQSHDYVCSIPVSWQRCFDVEHGVGLGHGLADHGVRSAACGGTSGGVDGGAVDGVVRAVSQHFPGRLGVGNPLGSSDWPTLPLGMVADCARRV